MASGVTSADDAPAQAPDKIPLLIVHSQPELDARIEATQLRLQDKCKYLWYFINVTEWSDWKKVFEEWPLPYLWPHMNNESYSKRVVYHIAAQNNGDVGRLATQFLCEGRFGDPANIDIVALNDLTSSPKRIHEVFRPDEVALYSESVLFKIFEWHFLMSKRILAENTAATNAPQVATSKSMSNSPMLRPAKHRKSKSQLSIQVPPNVNQHHLAVPPSAAPSSPVITHYVSDSRRNISAHVPIRPAMGMRGGDRAASGPMFDAPPGPKTGPAMDQRQYMPPTPVMSRLPHPLSQQSTPGQMMHAQPSGYPRRDMSGATVLSNANMAQLPPRPQPMSMPSGDMRLPHQMPGHVYGPPMPSHPAHRGALCPPLPPMGMGMPMSPMQPMQPMYFDQSMVPPGARPVEHGGGGMLYDPYQPSPAQNRQDFSRPIPRNQHANYSGYVEHSRNNSHNARGRKQSRGRGGGGRNGMQSYDGGRKQSIHAMDRPFQASGMQDSMPPPPPIQRAHRESFSHAQVKPQETERFPDFHQEQQEPFNIDNIPRELQCLRKFIGSDVEDMDSLWIGNVPHGTSDQMIQSLIEEKVHVPVVMVKPVMVDASKGVGWTIVTFHKTSDARLVLQKLEGFNFRGHMLDVQVPERCRHDLPGYKVQSRRSSNKQSVVDGPMPGIPVGPRSSFSRNNSIRQIRTNSLAHSDGSGRKNSIFSPQDARSDIPVLPDLPEVAEAVKDEANEGSVVSTSTVMHATAAPFVPPQHDSFDIENSGPTNKHLAVEEQFHRSSSSESLRRTSQGYDYEFAFEPSDEAGSEQAVEDNATNVSASSHSIEVEKSKSAEVVKNGDNVAGSQDDTPLTEELKVETGLSQISAAEDGEAVQEPTSYSQENPSVISIEEVPEAQETVQEKPAHAIEGENLNVIQNSAQSNIQEDEIIPSLSKEEQAAPPAQALPVPTSEADLESRTESVFSEAPTEILSDNAAEKTAESAARKSAEPAGSIHPFAKAKAKAANAQRQVSRADKKKAKKDGQAGKKKPEPVAPLTTQAPEPEILSVDEIKAKLRAKADSSKPAPAAKPELPLTEANLGALSVPVTGPSILILESSHLSSAAEEKVPASGTTKTENIVAASTITAPRLSTAPMVVPRVVVPRDLIMVKRTPSVTITADLPRKERQPSTASAASDSSFGTPKTAKEYQTPVPSPAPDISSSPPATPVVVVTEERAQATAGAEADPIPNEQDKVKVEVELETTEIGDSAPAVQNNRKKKNQQKKRLNRLNNKKNFSVDSQDDVTASQPKTEAESEVMLAKLKNLGCTGMDQESPPNADKETLPGPHDNNATPGFSSTVTGRDEKSSVHNTASFKNADRIVKENVSGTGRSWAQLLAGTGKSSTCVSAPTVASANISSKGSLTSRDTNVAQQYTKGG